MNAANKALELGDAKARADLLLRRMSALEAARRMAAEFHLCIYAVRDQVWASFYETDRNEVVRRLA